MPFYKKPLFVLIAGIVIGGTVLALPVAWAVGKVKKLVRGNTAESAATTAAGK